MVNKVIFEVNAETKQFLSKMDKTAKKFDSVAKKGAVAFAALSAGIVGLSMTFGKFETKATNVNTLLSGKELEKYGATIKNKVLGAVKDWGFSIDTAGDALFNAVSALGANQRAFQAYDQAQRLAIGGNTDIATSVSGLTSVMNAYTRNVVTAERASQIFFSAQKKGDTTVAALASNIGKVAPQADALGIAFDQTAAGLSRLTLAGLDTSEATTRLNSLFGSLIMNKDELKKIGVEVVDSAGNFNKFETIMAQLHKTTGGNTVQLQDLLKEKRAVSAATVLLSDNMAGYDAILEDVRKNTEELDNAVAKQSVTFNVAFNRFKGTMTAVAITLGEQLAPALLKVTGLISKMGEFILNHPGFVKFVAFTITGAAGLVGLVTVIAFSISKFILLGSVIMKSVLAIKALSLAIITNPIGLIVTAITIAVVALGVVLFKIRQRFGSFGNAFKFLFNNIKIAIGKAQLVWIAFVAKLINGYNKIADIAPLLKPVNNSFDESAKKIKKVNDELRKQNKLLLQFKPSKAGKGEKVKTFDDIVAGLGGGIGTEGTGLGGTLGAADGEAYTKAFVSAVQSGGDVLSAVGKTFSDNIWEGLGTAFFKPIGTVMDSFANSLITALADKLAIKAAGEAAAGFLATAGKFVLSLFGFSKGGDVHGYAGGGDIKIPKGDTAIAGFRPEDEFVMNAREVSAVQGGDFAMVGKGILDSINGGGGGTTLSFNFTGANFGDNINEGMIEKIFTIASEKIANKELIFQGS